MADENSKRDLPYGHFGHAAFDTDQRTWRFARHLSAFAPLRPLGQCNISQASLRTKDTPSSGDFPGTRRTRQIQALAAAYPDLQAASHLLPPFLRVSEAVQDATWAHDAANSRLLDFTSIRSGSRHKSTHVAATVTGGTGCLLRVVRIRSVRRGWGVDRKAWIESFTLDGEETIRDEHAGPIQQIEFARPLYNGGHLLAVRYLKKTVIFKLTHGRLSLDAATGSSICLDVLFTIDAESADGVHYSHVTFNPWFEQQVGIVDGRGSFAILEYKSGKLEQVTSTLGWSSGRKRSPSASSLGRGWARIIWVTNVETLAVCTRQALQIYGLSSDGPRMLKAIDLYLTDTHPWVLDFLVPQAYMDHCCLLTSTHLIIYQLTVHSQTGLTVVNKVKIRHFRNPDDMTLKIRSFVQDLTLCVLIFSSTGKQTTLYQFDLDGACATILRDPAELNMLDSGQTGPIVDLHIQPLSFINKDQDKQHAQENHRNPALRFFGTVTLCRDCSVSESIWYSLNSTNSENNTRVPNLEVPSWVAKSSGSDKLLAEKFVVDSVVLDMEGTLAEPLIHSRRARRHKQHPLLATGPSKDLELVGTALQEPIAGTESLEDILAEVTKITGYRNTETNTPMRTLLSLVHTELRIDDIYEATAAIEGSTFGEIAPLREHGDEDDGTEGVHRLMIAVIPIPGALNLGNTLVDGSLTVTYDNIVADWIGNLSSSVPGWVRLAKVAVARCVAAELVLASLVLRHQQAAECQNKDAPPTERQIPHAVWDLPVRPPGQAFGNQPSGPSIEQQHIQSSGLPTPSLTATPSIITNSTRSIYSSAPELLRLSKYVAFDKPTPLLPSRSHNKILAHWNVGTNPAEYDWQTISKDIARRQEAEPDEDMTERERRRLERRAERHIRRQRKEAAASQAQSLASSQAAEIFSASQPVMNVESQPSALGASSQSYGLGEASASQPVPWRYGGRLPPKKKRKSGF